MKHLTNLFRSTTRATVAMVITAGAVVPQQSRAEIQPQDKQSRAALEEVIVSATRTKKGRNAIPNTITLINQEQLADQIAIAPDLSSVLEKLVPGYSPSRQKISSGGESFRGRKPLILVDGVPQTNPLRDGARSGFTIDPEMVERIEVIHGSNAIQGLGATGGIINYVTKDADTSGKLRQQVSLKMTTSDEFDSDGAGYRGYYSISQKINKFDFLVSAAQQKRPVWFDGDGNTIGIDAVQGDTADSESYNYFGKFGYDFDENQRVELMLNRFQIEQSEDWIPSGGNRETGTPTIAVEGDIEGAEPVNNVKTASLTYTHDALAGGSLSLVGFYQDFEAVYGGGTFGSFQDPLIAPIGELYDQTMIVSEKYGARLTFVRDNLFDSNIDLVTGIDYFQDTSAQELIQTGRNRVPVIEFENITPFIQLDKQFFSRLTLSGGVRYETATLTVPSYSSVAGATRGLPENDPRWYTETPVDGGDPSFNETVYNFGAILQLTDELSTFASYSEGFTMADVGRAIRDLSEPNIDIDDYLTIEPIIVENEEVGITYDTGDIRLQASYFWSTSELGQSLRPNFDAEGSIAMVRSPIEIEGYDLSADWHVNDRLSFSGNYNHMRGKRDGDGDGSVDLPLDGLSLSPPKLSLSATGRLTSDLHARLQVTTFFDKNYDDRNTLDDFDGYSLVDLNFNYQTRYGKFILAVENLLDEFYFGLFSQTFANDDRQYAGRGRTLTVGYMLEF